MSSARLLPLTLLPLLAACERTELELQLSATPRSDLAQVVLSIEAVQLRDAEGRVERLDVDLEPVDLLRLTPGRRLVLVDGRELEEGRYESLRLLVDADESYVTRRDGGRLELTAFDEGDFAPLALTLEEGDRATRVVDLELRFSLADREDEDGGYAFDPQLSVIDPETAASLGGRIPAAQVESSACRGDRPLTEGLAVYLFSGREAVPRERNRAGGPLLSAPVLASALGDGYRYRFPLLPPGDYTVALTCEADEDDPFEAGETLAFEDPVSVTLEAEEEAVEDLD